MNEIEYQKMYDLEETHWWFKSLHHLVLKFIPKDRKNLSILDAGCGTGNLLTKLSKHSSTFGYDYNNNSIAFCKKRGLDKVWKRDLNKWNPKMAEFDCIISLDVISDKGIKNEKLALSNFHIALKEDGILILNVPALPVLRRRHDKAVTIKKRYFKKDLINLIDANHFKIEILEYRLPLIVPLIFISKVLGFLSKKSEVYRSDVFKVNKVINNLLLVYCKFDNFLISNKMNLPFGSSLFCVLKKNG